MVEEGRLAPDFTLPTDAGEACSRLSSLGISRRTAISIEKTTRRAVPLRHAGFATSGVRSSAMAPSVLGVSPDNPKKHAKFREKYRLPFTLLSDEDHAVAETYATWVEKRMYGKTYMGIERSTFVIDADGNVARIMRKVKPADHADDVLAALP